MTIDNIVNEIKKAQNIVILTHENPDGDAMGSSLGMYLALKQLGKNVEVVIPIFPNIYNFLPAINELKIQGSLKEYDLAIALDCGDIKRLNGFVKYFENAKTKITIDHHIINTMFGDYNFVNPVASATTEILINLFKHLNVEMTKEIGICLCTGIITDTGGLKYSNVTAETFGFMAEFAARGVNVSQIFRKTLDLVSEERFNLTKIAINRLELTSNKKIAYTYVTLEDQKKSNASEGDHEGIVYFGRDIEGIEVSVFLRETDKGIKVSLRSNEYVNVADIALLFGGGGHIRAAGCTISGTIEQAKEKMLKEINLHIKND